MVLRCPVTLKGMQEAMQLHADTSSGGTVVYLDMDNQSMWMVFILVGVAFVVMWIIFVGVLRSVNLRATKWRQTAESANSQTLVLSTELAKLKKTRDFRLVTAKEEVAAVARDVVKLNSQLTIKTRMVEESTRELKVERDRRKKLEQLIVDVERRVKAIQAEKTHQAEESERALAVLRAERDAACQESLSLASQLENARASSTQNSSQPVTARAGPSSSPTSEAIPSSSSCLPDSDIPPSADSPAVSLCAVSPAASPRVAALRADLPASPRADALRTEPRADLTVSPRDSLGNLPASHPPPTIKPAEPAPSAVASPTSSDKSTGLAADSSQCVKTSPRPPLVQSPLQQHPQGSISPTTALAPPPIQIKAKSKDILEFAAVGKPKDVTTKKGRSPLVPSPGDVGPRKGQKISLEQLLQMERNERAAAARASVPSREPAHAPRVILSQDYVSAEGVERFGRGPLIHPSASYDEPDSDDYEGRSRSGSYPERPEHHFPSVSANSSSSSLTGSPSPSGTRTHNPYGGCVAIRLDLLAETDHSVTPGTASIATPTTPHMGSAFTASNGSLDNLTFADGSVSDMQHALSNGGNSYPDPNGYPQQQWNRSPPPGTSIPRHAYPPMHHLLPPGYASHHQQSQQPGGYPGQGPPRGMHGGYQGMTPPQGHSRTQSLDLMPPRVLGSQQLGSNNDVNNNNGTRSYPPNGTTQMNRNSSGSFDEVRQRRQNSSPNNNQHVSPPSGNRRPNMRQSSSSGGLVYTNNARNGAVATTKHYPNNGPGSAAVHRRSTEFATVTASSATPTNQTTASWLPTTTTSPSDFQRSPSSSPPSPPPTNPSSPSTHLDGNPVTATTTAATAVSSAPPKPSPLSPSALADGQQAAVSSPSLPESTGSISSGLTERTSASTTPPSSNPLSPAGRRGRLLSSPPVGGGPRGSSSPATQRMDTLRHLDKSEAFRADPRYCEYYYSQGGDKDPRLPPPLTHSAFTADQTPAKGGTDRRTQLAAAYADEATSRRQVSHSQVDMSSIQIGGTPPVPVAV